MLKEKKRWIDISVGLKPGMVHWPGDPAFKLKRIRSLDKGDSVNLSRIDMGVHSGTHIDAPCHFIKGAKGIDRVALDALIGPARVIRIRDGESIKAKELKEYKIKRRERVIFKTRNSLKAWKSNAFYKDFVYVSQDAARYLAKIGILTIGVDYLSVGGHHKDGPRTHQILLKKGISVIEGLNLSVVKEGSYYMICLPVKILGSDGAPARVVLSRRY